MLCTVCLGFLVASLSCTKEPEPEPEPPPPPDTTPPKISFSTPENNKTYVVGEVPFSWNISDASGIASSSYSLNGVSKSINSSGNETLNLGNGGYELKVRAVDNKNNVKDTTVNFTVNIPPTYKYTINPFVQPNDSTLNWYGSGDVDGNNKVEQNDLNKLEQILAGTFTPNLASNNPVEYRTLDRADVNGDGKVDAVDKQILQEKLNGTREYFAGEWNKLKTRAEREEWLLKMIAIDKTDELTYIPDEFDCSEFADQFMINFHGSDELGYDKNKGLKDNGRFNIPVYRTSVTSTNFGHGMNRAVTGDILQTFSDHYHIEPQIDLGRNSNNWLLTNFPDGCWVSIRGPPKNGNLYSEGSANIRIDGGNITEFDINPNPQIRIIKTREESNALR